jgi:L-fuculose-phosphate aldolase
MSTAALAAPTSGSHQAIVPQDAIYRLDAELARIQAQLHVSGSLSLSRTGIGSQRLADPSLFVIGGFAAPVETERATAVVADLSGRVIAGSPVKVLREAIALHAAIYRSRPRVGAQLATHSASLVAFAAAHRPLPVRYSALLRQSGGQIDAIPVAPWSASLAPEPVLQTLDANPGTPAVLLANRGVQVIGRDLAVATRLLIVLEEGANFVLKAERLGGARDFPPGAFAAVAKGWNPDA